MKDQENDQSKQPTEQNQPKTDTQQKSISISPDKWNEMQSNFKHMSNTVHNLSTKLENAHKSDNTPKPSKHVNSSHDNKDYVSRDEFNKLVTNYKKLGDSVQHKNHHANVLQHAKDTLKMNHMKVSPTTFSQLLGADNRSTDANINWFKGIYKKINSKPRRFPPANHHTNKEPSIGKQLVKDDKTDGAMRNIDDCFKN